MKKKEKTHSSDTKTLFLDKRIKIYGIYFFPWWCWQDYWMLRKAMLQVKDWRYLCQKCSDFVLLLHWKPKQVLNEHLSPVEIWLVSWCSVSGSKGTRRSKKNKPNKTMGEGKNENRTCNVRFFMSSNLCLSCVQQTLQILRRKLYFVNRDKVPRGLFTSRICKSLLHSKKKKKGSYLFTKYTIILENALFGDFPMLAFYGPAASLHSQVMETDLFPSVTEKLHHFIPGKYL